MTSEEIIARQGEIEERKAQIEAELENPEADLDALHEEARTLAEESEQLTNQLQELAQHGYTDFPVYNFSCTQDAEGRMTWHCRCTLRGWGESTASFPTKRLAKHAAAFEMLCRVLAF